MSYFSQFTNRQAIPNRVISFANSGNWVAPTAGWVTIAVVGAGGSGGGSGTAGAVDVATGGGAGGFCVKTFYTPAGATYVITIGAGGANRVGANTTLSGASGGITTVNGTLCSLTCNSGSGGNAASGGGSATGGVGGNATGGDFNTTGGAGGAINNGASSVAATGGGAVNINGTAFVGGAVNGGVATVATGGAGVGGSGGDISVASRVSGGGGSGGPAYVVLENAGINYNPVPGGAGSPASCQAAPFLSFNGAGGAGLYTVGNSASVIPSSLSSNANVGGGGGGVNVINGGISGGNSAGFGGGGGALGQNNTNTTSLAGSSLMGGGGGGMAKAQAGTFASGAGGQGGVFIGFYGNNT